MLLSPMLTDESFWPSIGIYIFLIFVIFIPFILYFLNGKRKEKDKEE